MDLLCQISISTLLAIIKGYTVSNLTNQLTIHYTYFTLYVSEPFALHVSLSKIAVSSKVSHLEFVMLSCHLCYTGHTILDHNSQLMRVSVPPIILELKTAFALSSILDPRATRLDYVIHHQSYAKGKSSGYPSPCACVPRI